MIKTRIKNQFLVSGTTLCTQIHHRCPPNIHAASPHPRAGEEIRDLRGGLKPNEQKPSPPLSIVDNTGDQGRGRGGMTGDSVWSSEVSIIYVNVGESLGQNSVLMVGSGDSWLTALSCARKQGWGEGISTLRLMGVGCCKGGLIGFWWCCLELVFWREYFLN